jgi:hypothetical protein
MSTVALDLFIQDFVLTNRIMGGRCDWNTLVSRRFQESGPAIKVYQFATSDGAPHFVRSQILALPDADWLRIEMDRPAASLDAEEHRFDCLRMMQQNTHASFTVETDGSSVLVKLTTRHRGLLNVVFIMRSPAVANPFLA